MADGRRPVRYDTALALRELTASDPKLGELIQRVGPYTVKLKSQHSPFEALVESIIYQQIHGKAAFAILNRLLHAFGDFHPQPDHILAAPDEILRGCGLSANKMKALRDLAAKTLDGTVPTLSSIRRMSDEEIVERLTADGVALADGPPQQPSVPNGTAVYPGTQSFSMPHQAARAASGPNDVTLNFPNADVHEVAGREGGELAGLTDVVPTPMKGVTRFSLKL